MLEGREHGTRSQGLLCFKSRPDADILGAHCQVTESSALRS